MWSECRRDDGAQLGVHHLGGLLEELAIVAMTDLTVMVTKVIGP